jgi:hypothetical protein
MNERIQQLAVMAKLMAEEDINRQITYNAELKAFAEKFAELIVKECADISLKSGNIANKNIAAKIESERIYHKIKEHFGVEECGTKN